MVVGWQDSNLRWVYLSYTSLWLLLFTIWLRSALRHPYPLSILHRFLLLYMVISIAAALVMTFILSFDPANSHALLFPNSLFALSDFLYGVTLTAVARGFGITHFSINSSALLYIICPVAVSFLPNSVCDLGICPLWVATIFKGCIVAWCIVMILDMIGTLQVMNSAVNYMESRYYQSKAVTIRKRFGTLYAVLGLQGLTLLTTYAEFLNYAMDKVFSLSPIVRLIIACELFVILFKLRPKIEDRDMGDLVQPHLPFALALNQL